MRIRSFPAFTAAGVLACVFAAGAVTDPVVASPTAMSDTSLTATGQQGVDDLRECLARDGVVLNVYYLIDNSASMTNTDGNFVRADLLANSLRELAELREDITVNYAAGFFSTGFSEALPWRSTSRESVDVDSNALADTIRQRKPAGWTNWLTAIESAQSELAAQSATSPGCQALVWLTDGGIDLGGEARTAAAIRALCGGDPSDGATDLNSGGALAELRRAGVTVFGVLYLQTINANAQVMQKLVEGQAGGFSCGGSASAEESRGVYLHAEKVADLAVVFMRLGALVGGAAESPFGREGQFEVDPGIARFSIVTTDPDWTLTDPDGVIYTASNVGNFDIARAEGVSRISSPFLRPEDAGTWRWHRESHDDSLYYSSGLRIQLDQPDAFVVGQDNEVTGRITRDGAPFISLNNYRFDPLELSIVTGAGDTPVPVKGEFSEETGEFLFQFFAEAATGQVELHARLSGIATRPSGTPVADVAARLPVTVSVPDEYPSITPIPVALSELQGSKGVATGIFTLQAPKAGGAGKVCFPDGLAPIVTNDAVDRSATWAWTPEPAAEAVDGCFMVSPGGTVDVTLSAANEVAVNSAVQAHLRVEYRTESGQKIDGTVPISFTTTRPMNVLTFGLWAVTLLAAGILLPLGILWLLGWWFARVNRGKNLYRASVPVLIQPDGSVTAPDGTALSALQWGIEQFKFHQVEDDSRRFIDRDLGEVRARMPLNPFGSPWYQLEPKSGSRLIGSQGVLPAKLESLRTSGRLLGMPGDLGRLWALSIREGALSRNPAEPLEARLVAYLRVPIASSEAFSGRIASIATDPVILRQLRSIRSSVTDVDTGRAPRPASPGNVVMEPADEPPRRTRISPGVDEPPRRDRAQPGGAEPPRRDRSFSGSSEPPRRRPGSSPGDDPPRRQR